jgi:hypothetical protein
MRSDFLNCAARELRKQNVMIVLMGMASNGAQTLFIDADDTLWENNIYFERAIGRFISFLNHQEYSPEQVREILNEVERENIVTHGYGLHSFAHALVSCFERLSADPVTPELHATIQSFAHAIADHPVEILPDVPATLDLDDEGSLRRAIGQGGTFGAERVLPRSGNCSREGRSGIPFRGRQVRTCERHYLDDWKQPEI